MRDSLAEILFKPFLQAEKNRLTNRGKCSHIRKSASVVFFFSKYGKK